MYIKNVFSEKLKSHFFVLLSKYLQFGKIIIFRVKKILDLCLRLMKYEPYSI